MKFLAEPYIVSINKPQYKELLEKCFNLEMLLYINGNKDSILFEGWTGTKMGGSWYKINNYEEKIEMEFYDSYYHIIPPKKNQSLKLKFIFPFPNSLNEFISDCKRCGINLYWNKSAIKIYSPFVLLNENDLKLYYDNMLNKIGKHNG